MPTFYDRFCECAERWPSNVALELLGREHSESCTYAETRHMADSIGQWLTERGLERGARCAILADNHPRWVASYLGIIASGCTAVPLDTALHDDQVAKLLKDSGTKLVFCDAKHLAAAQKAASATSAGIVVMKLGEKTQATLASDLDSIFAGGPKSFKAVDSPPEAVASLLYTSGTTADPKGVMLTHANLMGEAEAVFRWADLGETDAILGVLPLFHVLSQMANLLLPLVKGVRVVYLETLNTTELMRALSERSITAFAVVPQFFYLIHERIFKEAAKRGTLAQSALRGLMRLNSGLRKVGINAGPVFFGKVHQVFGDRMRYLVTGGSRFDPQIARDFEALGIDVLQAYGLTETTGAAFVNSPGDNVIGSVGKPLPGVEGKIIDPQPGEDGSPASGEIAIRGAIIMKGYWNRPDATEAVLKDGWLLTGDLGYFDSSGHLFINGRRKEVIVLSNGKNIYPEEIEAHYMKSQFIKEIAVMGLEGQPGDPTSDRLHAVVVPNFDVLKERKIANAKEVIRFDIENLSSQLASTKRVGSYEIWQEDLPRTTTRKIKRFEVEKRARENQAKGSAAEGDVPTAKPLSDEDLAWLEQPDVQRALRIIREQASKATETLRPLDNLELDLGLDSMQRVEALVALEQELGGDVEESRLAEIYTVRDLVEMVRESAASGKTSSRPQFAGWSTVLHEEPTDPDILDLIKPRPISDNFWFLVSRFAAMLAYDRFQLRVSGADKFPQQGPYLICSNHQSFLDPLVLAGLLSRQIFTNLFAVGTSEIFGSGLMRKLAQSLRVVVVDPDANLVSAMRAGAFGLKHRQILILYPEGERSIDGTPRIFKKGAAILSIHMQAPIVPVAIDGFYEAWPRGKSFLQKFSPLRMKVGDPIIPPPESTASEETYERLTAEVKARILEMWEELRASSSPTGPSQSGSA